MMFLLILWFIFQKDKERMQGINFIAIDFETATGKRTSICEAGICVVKDSKVVETTDCAFLAEGSNPSAAFRANSE